jgi:hypothetical protein
MEGFTGRGVVVSQPEYHALADNHTQLVTAIYYLSSNTSAALFE